MLSLVQRPFWSAVVALIVLPAASLPAAEYFFDDFENYFSDEELLEVGGWQVMEVNTPVESAAWTVLNPKGRGNPATANGLPTDGQFIISDSDAAPQDPGDLPGTGMSHDIWSPSFSCAGATKVWLHMDSLIQMNNNGLCVFDVDVSTNDGTSWTNVRVAPSRSVPPVATLDNADGYLGRIDVDITTQAAGKPSVMFRLRQFEPNDDWYFSIDNVLVDDVAAPSGGAVNLLFERFSAGIPDSWEIASFADPPNEGTSTWNSEDACKRSALRFNGGKLPYQDGHGLHRLDAGYAILDSECDPDPAEDEYLITPTVDCSKATSVFFHFKSEINASTAATQVVLLSLDGGANFSETPIFTYYDTTNGIGSGFISVEDPFYAERVLEVPEAVGQSEVAFAFRYQSGGDEGWWAVDDVKVSAEGAGLPTRNCVNREFDVQPYDSATLSVTMTWKGIAGDGGFRILANGTQIGGDLPPTATTFTDNAPPAGGSVAYSLQTIVGGNVEFECTAPPLSVLSCPRDLTCCVNQTAGTVSLNWKNGSNLAGTGYRILRNNVPRATVGLAATSFVDDTVPGPGTYEYTLVLNGGNPAQCPDLPLKSSAIVLDASSAVFYDDFECYADDAAVSAAGWEFHEVGPPPLETAKWTVTDPGGRGNPPGPDGNATYGSRFLISDSDAGGGDDHQGSGRSHDVWTPRLDCTGKTPVWLHAACTLVLNNNGECMFEVDASNDNGSTWTNVFRRVAPARSRNGFIATCMALGGTEDDCNALADESAFPLVDIPEDLPGGPQVGNADGFYGQLHVDVTQVAANHPNVRLRFRQVEPSDDWWMTIDNVLIDTKPTPRGATTLLGPETFTDDIPGDWFIDSEVGIATWRGTDPCFISLLNLNGGQFPDSLDGHALHHLDTAFASVSVDDSCSTPAGNETLQTSKVDCTQATAVYLHFKSAINVQDAIAEVLLSTDGGATFDPTPLFSYSGSGSLLRSTDNSETIYNEHTLVVPQAAGKKDVVFAFHYNNVGNRVSFWAIDDVEVTADTGTSPENCTNGTDDDGDTKIDCADEDCASAPTCVGQVVFHRGDADENGQLQLTDAIRILGVLFLGQGSIPCDDAADADDNGQLQLTDAIRILGVLFLGTGTIPAPGPTSDPCGADPTEDGLGCASYTRC